MYNFYILYMQKSIGKSLLEPKWSITLKFIAVSLACRMEQLGVIFHSPLDWMLVHCRVTSSNKFTGTLIPPVERGTVRVKCLAQEHNAVSWPGFKPRLLNQECSTLTIRPPYYTCQLSRIMRECHACRSKISISPYRPISHA